MRQALCICRKELNVYFASPVAYIVIAIFLLVTGWFFFSTFFIFNQASLRNFFRLLPVVFAFVVPAVTMRQFAEELKQLRERLQGADRHAVQAEIMPYEHLLPPRFRGRNERIDERLP